jgi:hypothetical protein
MRSINIHIDLSPSGTQESSAQVLHQRNTLWITATNHLIKR